MNSMFRIFHGLAVAGGVLFASAAAAADIEWQGWSFDYTANENASGLVIKNVDYNGKRILSKASMPVMRVQYDRDVCGPYADILSATRLQPANSGAPNSACDGQSVCRRTFTQNGEQMLEVGSNWQIGEYQIYQTYYFSAEGYIDSRVYSRGLQCQVNHRHHAQWMFDFDIGDQNNDRILRGADDVQTAEFNDLTANTTYWTVEDTVTGDSVRLVPSDDDGSPDDFSQWDAAGRLYKSDEVGRWRLGSRGEIGNNYMSPQENIDGKDIVMWYISHLPHASSEGASIWHASGPRIEVVADTVIPEPEPDPEPEPQPEPDNLLVNGGFESNLAGWGSCGDANNIVINNNAQQGSNALGLSGGGCLYQEVPVTVGEDYTLTCQATRPGSRWSIMEFSYLDAGYNAIETEVQQISTGGNYTAHTASGTAPANTVYALALLYSEDQTSFDSCVLSGGEIVQPEPPAPVDPNQNILANGGFESELNNWFSCAQPSLSTVVTDADSGSAALAVTDGGCMYQEFEITPGSTYQMNCRARRDAAQQYTSVSLALLNASYSALESSELPVNSGFFADYSATLTAPDGSKFGSVVVYSEDPAVFDNCSVTAN